MKPTFIKLKKKEKFNFLFLPLNLVLDQRVPEYIELKHSSIEIKKKSLSPTLSITSDKIED